MSSPQIKKLLIGLAEFYGESLTPQRLNMFAEVLSDLSPEEVAAAIQNCTRDPRITRMPLPANLRQAVRPASNPDHEALEASNRIVEALEKFGWNNPRDARTFIGELGWIVVQREGGWEALCEATSTRMIPTLKAQWRELAKAIYARSQRGEIDTAPGLPRPINQVTQLAAKLSIGRDAE